MLNFDDKIDLDALFDSLNIGEAHPVNETADSSQIGATSNSGVDAIEIHELSALDAAGLFQFDMPTDQS